MPRGASGVLSFRAGRILKLCGLGLVAVALSPAASAQVAPVPAAKAPEICEADDEEGDAKPVPFWKRFAWEGACVDVSGEINGIWQRQKGKGARVPLLSTRQGAVSGASEFYTGNGSIRIDTTRQTPTGALKTGFEVKYERTSIDEGNGAVTLTEGILVWEFPKRLGSIKGGYTDSQVNYWSGDFQFSATAPTRTVALAGYEFKLATNWTLTLAYETGLPMTQQDGAVKFVDVYPKDPVASAKLYYENDDGAALQLAGLIHELKIEGSNPILALLNRPAQPHRELGWAATAGFTLPVKLGKEGSEVSAQATYAVNASPYLGTAADASSLAGSIGVPVTTEGWSAVASYHHVFSDRWEANVMASYLSLDIALPNRSAFIDTTRYAANLVWKPVENLKIGAEIGYLESEFGSGGVAGLFHFGLEGLDFGGRRIFRRIRNQLMPLLPGLSGPNANATSGGSGSGFAYYLFATYSF